MIARRPMACDKSSCCLVATKPGRPNGLPVDRVQVLGISNYKTAFFGLSVIIYGICFAQRRSPDGLQGLVEMRYPLTYFARRQVCREKRLRFSPRGNREVKHGGVVGSSALLCEILLLSIFLSNVGLNMRQK